MSAEAQVQGQAVDPGAMAVLAEVVGRDAVAAVIGVLVETSPPLVAAMREAAQAGDAAALKAAAHQLKGATANLGAVTLPTLCAELEVAAKTGAMALAGPLVEQAAQEYERVQRELLASEYANGDG